MANPPKKHATSRDVATVRNIMATQRGETGHATSADVAQVQAILAGHPSTGQVPEPSPYGEPEVWTWQNPQQSMSIGQHLLGGSGSTGGGWAGVTPSMGGTTQHPAAPQIPHLAVNDAHPQGPHLGINTGMQGVPQMGGVIGGGYTGLQTRRPTSMYHLLGGGG